MGEPPVVTCPDDIVYQLPNTDFNYTHIDYMVKNLTDNFYAIAVYDPVAGSTFYENTTTTVTVTAIDVSGNTDVCYFTVQILPAYERNRLSAFLTGVNIQDFGEDEEKFGATLYFTTVVEPYYRVMYPLVYQMLLNQVQKLWLLIVKHVKNVFKIGKLMYFLIVVM